MPSSRAKSQYVLLSWRDSRGPLARLDSQPWKCTTVQYSTAQHAGHELSGIKVRA